MSAVSNKDNTMFTNWWHVYYYQSLEWLWLWLSKNWWEWPGSGLVYCGLSGLHLGGYDKLTLNFIVTVGD